MNASVIVGVALRGHPFVLIHVSMVEFYIPTDHLVRERLNVPV